LSSRSARPMTWTLNQRCTHGVSSPIDRVRPLASERAAGEGKCPSSRAARSTRSRVPGVTFGRPRIARETVAVETPARAATALMPAKALEDSLRQEAAQHGHEAILPDRARDVVGGGPRGDVGVAARQAVLRPAEHLDVVVAV